MCSSLLPTVVQQSWACWEIIEGDPKVFEALDPQTTKMEEVPLGCRTGAYNR